MELSHYFHNFGIELTGALPLHTCHVRKPHLLRRAGFVSDELFVQIFAVPYLTPAADAADRNLSAYAVSEDYHIFFSQLFDNLLPRLRADFPTHHFAGFVDHSPIDEISAAVDAGLGVRGRHHLLLTNRYSSYVFLGEIITDLPLTPTLSSLPPDARVCHGCNKCQAVCPMQTAGGECRSALTQKKGELTEQEIAALCALGSVWGCDICQEVCPYTAHARNNGTIYTPVAFFHRATISHLTLEALDAMDDACFARRAYAWRGRQTIRRNLLLDKEHAINCKED
jgi:epoxyqueuosine reductase